MYRWEADQSQTNKWFADGDVDDGRWVLLPFVFITILMLREKSNKDQLLLEKIFYLKYLREF